MRLVPTVVAAALAAAGVGLPAYAVDVTTGSVNVQTVDPTQLGRLSRNSIPQSWAGGEPYPGTINDTTTYHFKTIGVDFAPNSTQDVYYDIDVDSLANDIFASAYLDRYDPTNKMANWLGDAGTSENYFGVDELFYDVIVPAGHTLQLVFNSTNTGGVPTSTANYQVYAYSDSMYDDDFTQVSAAPEPKTWALMMIGVGAIGWMLGYRKRVVVDHKVKLAAIG